MNTPTQSRMKVSQATTASASLSRRALCGRALNLAASLVVGACYLSGSASRHTESGSDHKQSEQDEMWDTEWEKIPF